MDRYSSAWAQVRIFLTATPRMCGQRSMTGVRWAGPALYGEYLVALHGNMVDARTRRLIFADSAAYLEGDCADSSTGGINRLAYCVPYDVTGDKISAMRCYGAIAHLAP
jgi:hypothetical protein